MKLAFLTCAVLVGCASQRGATEANLVDGNNASPLGELIYKQRCASCHGERGQGKGKAPALLGDGVLASSEHHFKNGQELFDFVADQMPKNAPGTLSMRDNWAVVSYLIGANGIAVPRGGLSESNAADVPLARE